MDEWGSFSLILIFFTAVILFLVGFDYMALHYYTDVNQINQKLAHALFASGIYDKYVSFDIVWRMIASLSFAGAMWLIPPSKRRSKLNEKSKKRNVLILIVFGILFWYGFVYGSIFGFYNLIIYPIITLLHFYLLAKVIGTYRKQLNNQNILGCSSHGESNYSFSFDFDPDDEVQRDENLG